MNTGKPRVSRRDMLHSSGGLEAVYGVNKGLRRNHTKGVSALGGFIGSAEAASLSRSLLFSGERIDVEARFSLAGGDPQAADTEKTPRGLALDFRLPGGALHHIAVRERDRGGGPARAARAIVYR